MMLFAPLKLALKIAGVVVAVIVLYFLITLVQVWLTSRDYDPHPAGAILVMGAAQYNGVPSPDLRARLDEALSLYRNGYARLIVVTGSKEPSDTYTEAEAGARYLESKGVPASDIVRAGGDNTYENMEDAADKLSARKTRVVLVTTDPFHEDRSMAIASDMDLDPSPTPTMTSPIAGWLQVPFFLKEAGVSGWAGSSGTTTWSGCTTREGQGQDGLRWWESTAEREPGPIRDRAAGSGT